MTGELDGWEPCTTSKALRSRTWTNYYPFESVKSQREGCCAAAAQPEMGNPSHLLSHGKSDLLIGLETWTNLKLKNSSFSEVA